MHIYNGRKVHAFGDMLEIFDAIEISGASGNIYTSTSWSFESVGSGQSGLRTSLTTALIDCVRLTFELHLAESPLPSSDMRFANTVTNYFPS